MDILIIKDVLLSTPQDVKDFCNLMNTTPRAASIVVKHNEYTVSGRSILGMYSLNLSEPVTVKIIVPVNESKNFDEESFLNELKKWSV